MIQLIPILAPILDKLIPDSAERERIAGEMASAAIQAEGKQADINAAAASHSSLFVAGARPAALWLGVIGFGYVVFGQPLGNWLLQLLGLMTGLTGLPALPALEENAVHALLFGLLGLGGYRSIEKVKGVARSTLSPRAPR